jgi:hypothetical protein
MTELPPVLRWCVCPPEPNDKTGWVPLARSANGRYEVRKLRTRPQYMAQVHEKWSEPSLPGLTGTWYDLHTLAECDSIGETLRLCAWHQAASWRSFPREAWEPKPWITAHKKPEKKI